MDMAMSGAAANAAGGHRAPATSSWLALFEGELFTSSSDSDYVEGRHASRRRRRVGDRQSVASAPHTPTFTARSFSQAGTPGSAAVSEGAPQRRAGPALRTRARHSLIDTTLEELEGQLRDFDEEDQQLAAVTAEATAAAAETDRAMVNQQHVHGRARPRPNLTQHLHQSIHMQQEAASGQHGVRRLKRNLKAEAAYEHDTRLTIFDLIQRGGFDDDEDEEDDEEFIPDPRRIAADDAVEDRAAMLPVSQREVRSINKVARNMTIQSVAAAAAGAKGKGKDFNHRQHDSNIQMVALGRDALVEAARHGDYTRRLDIHASRQLVAAAAQGPLHVVRALLRPASRRLREVCLEKLERAAGDDSATLLQGCNTERTARRIQLQPEVMATSTRTRDAIFLASPWTASQVRRLREQFAMHTQMLVQSQLLTLAEPRTVVRSTPDISQEERPTLAVWVEVTLLLLVLRETLMAQLERRRQVNNARNLVIDMYIIHSLLGRCAARRYTGRSSEESQVPCVEELRLLLPGTIRGILESPCRDTVSLRRIVKWIVASDGGADGVTGVMTRSRVSNPRIITFDCHILDLWFDHYGKFVESALSRHGVRDHLSTWTAVRAFLSERRRAWRAAGLFHDDDCNVADDALGADPVHRLNRGVKTGEHLESRTAAPREVAHVLEWKGKIRAYQRLTSVLSGALDASLKVKPQRGPVQHFSLRSSSWSFYEDALLQLATKHFGSMPFRSRNRLYSVNTIEMGRNFDAINRLLPTKSRLDLYNRVQSLIEITVATRTLVSQQENSSCAAAVKRRRDDLLPREVTLLVRGLRRFGCRWTKICKTFLPHHSPRWLAQFVLEEAPYLLEEAGLFDFPSARVDGTAAGEKVKAQEYSRPSNLGGMAVREQLLFVDGDEDREHNGDWNVLDASSESESYRFLDEVYPMSDAGSNSGSRKSSSSGSDSSCTESDGSGGLMSARRDSEALGGMADSSSAGCRRHCLHSLYILRKALRRDCGNVSGLAASIRMQPYVRSGKPGVHTKVRGQLSQYEIRRLVDAVPQDRRVHGRRRGKRGAASSNARKRFRREYER